MSNIVFKFEELNWKPPNEVLNNSSFKFPDFFCFASGTICCALAFYSCVLQIFLDKDKINYEELNSDDAFKILQSNTPSACLYSLGDLTNQASQILIELTKNLEHWRIPQNQNSIYFFISNWLKGKNPPPRCQALLNDGVLCLEEASSKLDTPYCDILHRCKVSACKNKRTNVEGFCTDHCCLYKSQDSKKKSCNVERFKGADFCVKHLCIGCLFNKSTSIKQRNPIACLEHKCTQRNCNLLQVHPHRFCIDHLCLECASSGRIDDNSKQKDSKSFICDFHKCSVSKCDIKRFDEKIKFCSYHICRKCASKNQINGADLLCSDSQLCSEHRCLYSETCYKEKLISSDYCLEHSCKECISLKCPKINSATEKAPRNTCKSHPLCEYISSKGKLCKNLVQKSSLYCTEHKEGTYQPKADQNNHGPCSGITTKKKENCKSKQAYFKIKGKWYCFSHRDQAGNLEIDVSDDDSSDEDNDIDKEKDNSSKMIDLKPVLIRPEIKKFKKICCNGMIGKEKRCEVNTFCQDSQSVWFCPIHDVSNEITKNNEASTELKEILGIVSQPPLMLEKKDQIILKEEKNETIPKLEKTKNEKSLEKSDSKAESRCK